MCVFIKIFIYCSLSLDKFSLNDSVNCICIFSHRIVRVAQFNRESMVLVVIIDIRIHHHTEWSVLFIILFKIGRWKRYHKNKLIIHIINNILYGLQSNSHISPSIIDRSRLDQITNK